MKGGTTAFALSTKTKMVAGIAAAVLAVSMSTAAMQTEDAWAVAYTASGTNAGNTIDAASGDAPATPGTDTVAKDDVWFTPGSAGDSAYGWHQAGSSWTYVMNKSVCTGAGIYTTSSGDPSNGVASYTTTQAPVTGFVTNVNRNNTSAIYYFNSAGIMQTGWQHITLTGGSPSDSGKGWYYFKPTGEMIAGDWVLYNGEWYYMLAEHDTVASNYNDILGSLMSSNPTAPATAKEIVSTNNNTILMGQMNTATAVIKRASATAANTVVQPSSTYFFNTNNGAMARNYMLTNNKGIPQAWICDDGSIVPGTDPTWIQTNGKWYYAQKSTVNAAIAQIIVAPTATNYTQVPLGAPAVTYCFDKMGVMQTGWVNTSTSSKAVWYYYDNNGAQVTNAWVDYAGQWYWMGSDGKMVTNQWVDNGQYYVGKDGAWIPSEENAAATDDSIVSENPYNVE